jgi:hypothetical protein
MYYSSKTDLALKLASDFHFGDKLKNVILARFPSAVFLHSQGQMRRSGRSSRQVRSSRESGPLMSFKGSTAASHKQRSGYIYPRCTHFIGAGPHLARLNLTAQGY